MKAWAWAWAYAYEAALEMLAPKFLLRPTLRLPKESGAVYNF